MSSPDIDALFDFPCDFPIKVMGATHPEFRDAVVTVIREFDDQFDIERIETRPSSGGKYTGLSDTEDRDTEAACSAPARARCACPRTRGTIR